MCESPRHRGCDPVATADAKQTVWESRLPKACAAQSQGLARLRRQRAVERICKIPRLVDELLDEIGRHHGLNDDIAYRLERYAAAALDRGLLTALGADRFPALPMRVVGSAR
jgi:hypothetical protein